MKPSKPESPAERAEKVDRQEKLLLLSAALFAVRLFRAEPQKYSLAQFSGDNQPAVLNSEAIEREEAAKRSALDAAAILIAVEEVGT